MLGWQDIECIVQDITDPDNEHLDRAHENLIRADLNPVEEARITWDLVYQDGRGIEKTSRLLCKTISWVETRLEIAKFPDDIKDSLTRNEIKVSVARELGKVKSADTRAKILSSAIDYGASANVVKQWISDMQAHETLPQSAVVDASGDISVIDRTQVTLPCRICDQSNLIDVLRHVWVCPDCLGAVRELSREMQRQMAAASGSPAVGE
jgi:hypothetical protein